MDGNTEMIRRLSVKALVAEVKKDRRSMIATVTNKLWVVTGVMAIRSAELSEQVRARLASTITALEDSEQQTLQFIRSLQSSKHSLKLGRPYDNSEYRCIQHHVKFDWVGYEPLGNATLKYQFYQEDQCVALLTQTLRKA